MTFPGKPKFDLTGFGHFHRSHLLTLRASLEQFSDKGELKHAVLPSLI